MQDSEILTILKVVIMAVFFIIVSIFGTLPIRSKNFKKRPLLRSIGTTFAGCLFLNVAIMHILPQAADTLEQYLKGDDKESEKEVFPLAYLLLMVGFIITVFFTKVMSFHSHQEDHQEEQVQNGESSQDTQNSPRKKFDKQEPEVPNMQLDNQPIKPQLKQSLLSQQSEFISKKYEPKQKRPQKIVTANLPKNQPQHNHPHPHPHAHDHQHDHSQHDHQQHGHHHHVLENKSMLNQAFILTIAIYFHTIFEGIAIGVQNSITGFLSTAVAIAFHKWADALSMGCHYKSKNIKKNLAYTLIFIQALLNVLSIGLGWIISSSGDVVQAIFLSISAGTFLAISTIEMLGEQLHHKQYMWIKFLLLVGATGFVAAIWFLENSIFQE